jgi:hypothetical protein
VGDADDLDAVLVDAVLVIEDTRQTSSAVIAGPGNGVDADADTDRPALVDRAQGTEWVGAIPGVRIIIRSLSSWTSPLRCLRSG